jgi:hypothetical protein
VKPEKPGSSEQEILSPQKPSTDASLAAPSKAAFLRGLDENIKLRKQKEKADLEMLGTLNLPTVHREVSFSAETLRKKLIPKRTYSEIMGKYNVCAIDSEFRFYAKGFYAEGFYAQEEFHVKWSTRSEMLIETC